MTVSNGPQVTFYNALIYGNAECWTLSAEENCNSLPYGQLGGAEVFRKNLHSRTIFDLDWQLALSVQMQRDLVYTAVALAAIGLFVLAVAKASVLLIAGFAVLSIVLIELCLKELSEKVDHLAFFRCNLGLFDEREV